MIALNEFAGGQQKVAIPLQVKHSLSCAKAFKKAFTQLCDDKMFFCCHCQQNVTPIMRETRLFCPLCDKSAGLQIKLQSD